MSYYDSSALVKRYLDEDHRDFVDDQLRADLQPVTSAVSIVEVRRALRGLSSAVERSFARVAFEDDLASFSVVAVDATAIEGAAAIAESSQVRSLDALHLAAAIRSGVGVMVTFDRRQAEAAAALGLAVVPTPDR